MPAENDSKRGEFEFPPGYLDELSRRLAGGDDSGQSPDVLSRLRGVHAAGGVGGFVREVDAEVLTLLCDQVRAGAVDPDAKAEMAKLAQEITDGVVLRRLADDVTDETDREIGFEVRTGTWETVEQAARQALKRSEATCAGWIMEVVLALEAN